MVKKYYTELESLRGVAALWVCLFHVGNWYVFTKIGGLKNFDLFVDFFFVLSGFVIALNFSKSVTDYRSFKNYLIKRFFRLYPLFFVLSVPYIVTSILKTYYGVRLFQMTNYFKLDDFLYYITLTSKWGFTNDLMFNRPSWSISVELLLYVIAGLLFLTKPTRKSMIIISAGLCIISLIILSKFTQTLVTTGSFSIFRGIYSFFTGVIVCQFLTGKEAKTWVKLAYLLISLLCISMLFWLMRLTPWVSFLFPVMWAVVIYGISNCKYPVGVNNILNMKPVLWLGTISYSIYLIHPLMIFLVEKMLKKASLETQLTRSITGAVLLLALTVGLASITYLFVEVPGKNLYKKFKTNNSKTN